MWELAVCEVFHIMPWDLERLTVRTFVGMVDTLEARAEAAKKADQEARRRRG